jgi:O-antigen chain-terminating methyltransferase
MKPAHSYLAFENAFRGSREAVLEEQRPYLDHFRNRAPVLDVGCGRGEFLEIARGAGLEASGIDTSDEMLEECRERGLSAVRAEALEYLESLPGESLGGIFASHIIEHLAPPDVPRFIDLSFSALRDGGLLLVETLNPGCLFSFAPFFMDPTHRFPVHPRVLDFYLREAGFGSVDFTYREYFLPDFLTLRQPPPASPSEFESACIENFRKLQMVLDAAFSHFIYAAAAVKTASPKTRGKGEGP